jgi:NitT/TauT family transport system substrate-binding protein
MLDQSSVVANCFAVLRPCVSLLALVLLVGCNVKPSATGSEELVPVRLLLDWYPQPEQGGFYQALVKGYYRDSGLDVTIEPGAPNVFPLPRLSSGGGEFAIAASDALLVLNGQGLDLVAVGAYLQQDPQAVLLHQEDPAKSFSDLDGRTVAVVPGATWFRYLVQKFKLRNIREIPETYSLANFVQDPTYIKQTFITSEPYFLQKMGIKSKTFPIKDAGYDPYRVFCTTRRYLNEHRDVVRKFVAASIRGWKDYLADPNAANQVIKKLNPELNNERMQFSWRALRDGHFIEGEKTSQAVGQLDPQRWQNLYNILLSVGLVPTSLDPTKSFTTQFTDNP